MKLVTGRMLVMYYVYSHMDIKFELRECNNLQDILNYALVSTMIDPASNPETLARWTETRRLREIDQEATLVCPAHDLPRVYSLMRLHRCRYLGRRQASGVAWATHIYCCQSMCIHLLVPVCAPHKGTPVSKTLHGHM